ncbi:hypothetical protein Sru01_20290 [Sphaerisporangium rufum]|uniref:Uncharacterized protein n=1 Tax=Sphaerisporangium rufum TaxID=1381558 RepID=A0A919R4R9_9ACTN|nr:hypothetical protein [Sphaerisporangium rufum]GII77047.1 hypothetical protein Sru01_20290 [Sphaerisporangium rufum]
MRRVAVLVTFLLSVIVLVVMLAEQGADPAAAEAPIVTSSQVPAGGPETPPDRPDDHGDPPDGDPADQVVLQALGHRHTSAHPPRRQPRRLAVLPVLATGPAPFTMGDRFPAGERWRLTPASLQVFRC